MLTNWIEYAACLTQPDAIRTLKKNL